MVVGIGPGDREYLAPRAVEAIGECDVIIGYKTYIDLISDFISNKKVEASGMKEEVDRAERALELAGQGQKTVVISSGDPGVYGMAGLVLEVAGGKVPVEIVPGITAASAAAASLGAPIVNDFAAISLSDLLVSWEKITKRIEAAASSDFVIVFYNPKSQGRPKNINTAREIILKHRSPETPVGIVRSAGRGTEEKTVTTLKNMLEQKIDMLSTVIVGNSETVVKNGFIITPRGYKL